MDNNKFSFLFSGLKSAHVKLILALVFSSLAGSGIYMLAMNDTDQKATVQQEKDKVQPPDNINVSVNNVINNISNGKPQASTTITVSRESVVIIPMESKPQQAVNLGNLPQQQTKSDYSSSNNNEASEKPKKVPEMGVVDDNTQIADNGNATNPISGVDSSIGTGEVGSKIEKLKSPYTIFAGEVLPIVLDTPINSDKRGIIRATIARNIYDSVTQQSLLIPQGSKVVGIYDNKVAYAANRLMIGWNRLIYPNGASVNLKGQPGTDLQGFAGFSDTVDNHYDKVFGAAFITGAIFGVQTYAMGNQTTNPYQLSAGATIAQQVGAQMANTGVQVVQKGLDIPPTVIISAGYEGGLALTQDLILKKYVFRSNR